MHINRTSTRYPSEVTAKHAKYTSVIVIEFHYPPLGAYWRVRVGYADYKGHG